MKFDVFNWLEVAANQTHNCPEGRLRLRFSQPCALYVEAEGYEALAGVATDFNLEVPQGVDYRIDGPPGVRCFVESIPGASHEPEGEVFTNQDRRPHESGAVLEVKRALREMQIEHQRMLREARSINPPSPAIEAIRAEVAEAVQAAEPETTGD